MLNDAARNLVNRAYFLRSWTEIPRAIVLVGMFVQQCTQQQIAGKRFEHVLPGPGRCRTAELNCLSRLSCTDAIRNNAVRGPVPSPDDVSGPHRRCTQARAAGKKRTRERREHQFRGGLGGAVGVVAAEPIGFTIAPYPVHILVALVRGGIHERAHRFTVSDRLEQVCRTQDVGLQGSDRVIVRASDERLRGEMEDVLWFKGAQMLRKSRQVTRVTDHMPHPTLELQQRKMIGRGIRRQRVTHEIGAELTQKETQPRAFESRMTRYQYALAGEGTKHCRQARRWTG